MVIYALLYNQSQQLVDTKSFITEIPGSLRTGLPCNVGTELETSAGDIRREIFPYLHGDAQRGARLKGRRPPFS